MKTLVTTADAVIENIHNYGDRVAELPDLMPFARA